MNHATTPIEDIDKALKADRFDLMLVRQERAGFDKDPGAYLRKVLDLLKENRRLERELHPSFGIPFYTSPFIPKDRVYVISGIAT